MRPDRLNVLCQMHKNGPNQNHVVIARIHFENTKPWNAPRTHVLCAGQRIVTHARRQRNKSTKISTPIFGIPDQHQKPTSNIRIWPARYPQIRIRPARYPHVTRNSIYLRVAVPNWRLTPGMLPTPFSRCLLCCVVSYGGL